MGGPARRYAQDGPLPGRELGRHPLFDSGESPYSAGTGYSNPEVDALLAEARAAPDEALRRQRFAEAQRLILADVPQIPMIFFADARLLNDRVSGLRFSSLGWADLWKAWVR